MEIIECWNQLLTSDVVVMLGQHDSPACQRRRERRQVIVVALAKLSEPVDLGAGARRIAGLQT